MHRMTSAAILAASSLTLTSTALAERPRIANSVKYRETTTAHAHGRAGNATIEARALAGRDGVTTLDVTAGSFEAPAGQLEKIRVKIPTIGDDVTFNYNGLAGAAFTAALQNLLPGAALQVQASVTGVDAERTGIVTADLTVRRRPDLEVSMLAAPPHGVTGIPLRVTALVSEKNGDSGARADCVLYSGDTELRRARGIWVDAGTSVTCSFAWPFDSAGVKPLRVVVERVSPADDDPANDAAAGETQVYDHAEEIPQWSTTAQEFYDRSTSRTASSQFASYRESEETRQISVFSGTIRGPLNIHTVQVSSEVLTDGELLYDGSQIQEEWFSLPPWFSSSGGADLYGDGFDGYMLSYGSGENQTTTIDLRRVGGEVTYHEEGFELGWDGYYTWNYSGSFSHGPIARPYGSTVSMTVAVSDGITLWESRESLMTMQSYSRDEHNGPICYTHPWYGYTCLEWTSEGSGKHGYDDPGM